MTKRGLYTVCHSPQFSQISIEMENTAKKSSLNSSKNHLLRQTHFAKKIFMKCSQIWRITLYTLFAFHTDFIHSFHFCHCSRRVCSGFNTHRPTLGLFEYSRIILLNISITHAVLPLAYRVKLKILELTYWTHLVIRCFMWCNSSLYAMWFKGW